MSTSRHLAVGVVTRTSGRWTVRRRYRIWSPTRWALLILLERLPVRVLGFFAWHGVLRYPQLRWSKSPGPLNAAALVALWIVIALIRDRLPRPVTQWLLD